MNWSFLFFLAEPWFVVPWYTIGALGAWYVIYDTRNHNTVLKPAMHWAWPIIVFFFSVIGIALYFATARVPGIEKIESQEEKHKAHNRYEESMWRRVNGAVIHCVAGDGLGIMTGMVIARAASMNFWQEFWFEYFTGFVIGWFIFQRKSMTRMTDSLPMQLGMAFRGEFFSMLTVMGGMGAVMTYITPLVASQQPKPLTAAFWGFGMLGLLIGYVFTFPMNWLMVKVGWKHGMGGMEGAERHQIKEMPWRFAAVGAMLVLGCAGLLAPAWLTFLREKAAIQNENAAVAPDQSPELGKALYQGLHETVDQAAAALARGNQTRAAISVDSAFRIAQVGAYSAPAAFHSGLEQISNAKLALEQGDQPGFVQHLEKASKVIKPAQDATPAVLDLAKYKGAKVIDQKGAIIGEVTSVTENSLEMALGGWRDAWGFVDLSSEKQLTLPARSVAFGPPRAVGMKLVAVAQKEAGEIAGR